MEGGKEGRREGGKEWGRDGGRKGQGRREKRVENTHDAIRKLLQENEGMGKEVYDKASGEVQRRDVRNEVEGGGGRRATMRREEKLDGTLRGLL